MSADDLLNHPVFSQAVADLRCLGLEVSANSRGRTSEYVVVGGRSNSRWWLVPIENPRVAAASLALFQPTLPSARLLAQLGRLGARLGLARLWPGTRVYVSGDCSLHRTLPSRPQAIAIFTGTNSPHRKTTLQIMDARGRPQAFAKITRDARVRGVVAHEASTLAWLRTLSLHSANVPSVITHSEFPDVSVLVTDTTKTVRSRTVVEFGPQHNAFVHELRMKTRCADRSIHSTVQALADRTARLAARISPRWRERMDVAATNLLRLSGRLGAGGMVHGDFTPWNTYLEQGHLSVFDWEYAETGYPSTFDVLHFAACTERGEGPVVASRLRHRLLHLAMADSASTADLHLQFYAFAQALRRCERADTGHMPVATWDGERIHAAILDAVAEASL